MNDKISLIEGDCIEELKRLPENSVDTSVTDPPYGIRFMGKAWDGKDIEKMANERSRLKAGPGRLKTGRKTSGITAAMAAGKYDLGVPANRAFQQFSEAWGRELFRVLKPGAFLVSFASTRTYHRMVCGLEDAGFEIRDQLAWVFGSGFPKSSNQKGRWKGWGSALKPAWEPIVLARKPMIGTIPENLAVYGTGALNIDACRIGVGRDKASGGNSGQSKETGLFEGGIKVSGVTDYTKGRWPANLCHDGSPEVVAMFPMQESGQQAEGGHVRNADKTRSVFGAFKGQRVEGDVLYGDSGSASRFFYCAKTDRNDRDAGLEHMQKRPAGFVSNTSQQHLTRRDAGYEVAHRANIHPTVKPTALMRWLCRLVTPPGGTIIDPFMGSGSTGRGAVLEGFKFIGIEKDANYMPIARARIKEAIGELFA